MTTRAGGGTVSWNAGFPSPDRLAKNLYLITLLNRTGFPLTADYLCDDFAQYKTLSHFLSDTAKMLLRTDIAEYISKYYIEDKNGSVLDTFIALCKSSEIHIDELEALVKGLAMDNAIIEQSRQLSMSDVFFEIDRDLSAEDELRLVRNSEVIYAFNRLSEDEIAEYDRTGIPGINTAPLCERAERLLKIPFYKFRYVDYYSTVQRRYWSLKHILSPEEFWENIVYETTRHIEMALNICATGELIKTYRCLARIYEREEKRGSTLKKASDADTCDAYSDRLEAFAHRKKRNR